MTVEHPSLRARRVGIDTWREFVAYLHRACPLYRTEGYIALSKVEVRANGRRLLATVNIVDDERIVGERELGLSEEAWAELGVTPGAPIEIALAEPPASIAALRTKLRGEVLPRADWFALVRDIAERRYSKIELAAFVTATAQTELERDEVLALTEAMVAAGRRLDWRETPVVDKHCVGGIPGNRTSMLLVPIVAAHGMLIPKTSSRAITSPAGTADTMAVLADVALGVERMQAIVRELRGCLAWGGTAGLSPADDVLISVERPLGIDSPGQMVASILSKKLAAGSTHLVIDIPVGPSAKVRSQDAALQLKKLFEAVGRQLGLVLDVVVSDGRQPVGRGIGPVLEARDVMAVLHNDPGAPLDLRQKALRLAGRVIEFSPDVRGGEGYAIARDILDSGRALAKMEAIVAAQGARDFDWRHPPLAPLSFEVTAPTAGRLAAYDNEGLARIARLAGAPKSPGAGVDLIVTPGATLRAGDPLYRVHAQYASELEFARERVARDPASTLDPA
jgi:thymidine phosphorylase